MKFGRTPSKEEIEDVLVKQRDTSARKVTIEKELSELELDGWLVYESEISWGATLGSMGLRACLPKKGQFDIICEGNKTFVHRIK